jgi:hypothetical protein
LTLAHAALFYLKLSENLLNVCNLPSEFPGVVMDNDRSKKLADVICDNDVDKSMEPADLVWDVEKSTMSADLVCNGDKAVEVTDAYCVDEKSLELAGVICAGAIVVSLDTDPFDSDGIGDR